MSLSNGLYYSTAGQRRIIVEYWSHKRGQSCLDGPHMTLSITCPILETDESRGWIMEG